MTPKHHEQYIREQVYCCNCMKKRPIDPHHIKQIGMGKKKKKNLIEHYSCIPVCRKCHTEYHNIGRKEFEKKHNINIYEQVHHFLSKHIFEIYKRYENLLEAKQKGNIVL